MKPEANSCGFPGAGFHLTHLCFSCLLLPCSLFVSYERQSTVNFAPSSSSDLNMDWPSLCLPQLATSASQTLNENFFPQRMHKRALYWAVWDKVGPRWCPGGTLLFSKLFCMDTPQLQEKKKIGKQSFLDMFLKSVRSLQWHVFLIVVMFYSLPVLALETCNDLDLSIFVRNWIICHFSATQVMLVSSKYFLICT